MPSFQISDPTAAVSLADATEGGKPRSTGRVTFVVENLTPQRRTAAVRLIPNEAVHLPIYALEGAQPTGPDLLSLDFAPKEVKNVTVRILAPHGANEAAHSFRLRVMLESDPDNDGVESRPVAFKVPAAAASPAPKPGFPWPALVAGLVLLAAVGGGITYVVKGGFSSAEKETAIQRIDREVKGKSLEFARGVAAAQGLTGVPHIVQNDAAAPNTVLAARADSDPKKVLLDHDPGLAGLKGQTIEAAKARAEGWGLPMERLPPGPEDRGEPGIVLRVALNAGPPPRLHLVYEDGIEVPNLQGETLARMNEVFTGLAGKAVGSITAITDDPQKCGTTVSTQLPLKDSAPGAKSLYPQGTTFTFTVAKGSRGWRSCYRYREIIDRPRGIQLSPNVRFDPAVDPSAILNLSVPQP